MFQKTSGEGVPQPHMFDGFTPTALRVMAYANQEAQRLGHNYIGTEHMLLALVRVPECVGALILKERGLTRDLIQAGVMKELAEDKGGGEVPLIPDRPLIRTAIENAIHEAGEMKHDYIGTEHFVLGLLGAREGVAAAVLLRLGVSLEGVRDDVRTLVTREGFVHPEREKGR